MNMYAYQSPKSRILNLGFPWW